MEGISIGNEKMSAFPHYFIISLGLHCFGIIYGHRMIGPLREFCFS